jgi:plasmid stabilization system protein ParE
MRIQWSSDAERDRQEVWDFIAESDIVAADRMVRRFEEAIDHIASFPLMGRPGALAGSREFIPHPNYRIVYHVGDDAIIIHAILHTARPWPPVSGD